MIIQNTRPTLCCLLKSTEKKTEGGFPSLYLQGASPELICFNTVFQTHFFPKHLEVTAKLVKGLL